MKRIILFLGFLCIPIFLFADSGKQEAASVAVQSKKPKYVRGIHITAWVAGSKKARKRIDALLNETELNAVVIDIKEIQGEIYIPGVRSAEELGLHVKAIPDLTDYLKDLKDRGIYTIARMVVFKDNGLSRKKPELAVKRSDGSVWKDHKNNAWVDPYNHKVWDYDIEIAARAAQLGFDEVQFDYIRFPSDGNIKECRYSYAHHTSTSSSHALNSFLQEASQRLKPMGVNLSIDLFGLTPSVTSDMGIGQKIIPMTQLVDFVSPMVYPSHYAKGEYGIDNPNKHPYPVVYKTISDAKNRFNGELHKVRPYLQDFSLGVKYGPREVRAQILACEHLGVKDWLLWNSNCVYTREALKSKDGVLAASAEVPESMMVKPEKKNANTHQTSNLSPEKLLPIPSVEEKVK